MSRPKPLLTGRLVTVARLVLFVFLFLLGGRLRLDRLNRCGFGTTLGLLYWDEFASLCVSSNFSCSHNVYV